MGVQTGPCMATATQHMTIKKRLFLVLLGIFIVVMAGTNGYYILYGGQSGFLDCMYMTVISLTGVGYGEVLQVTGNVPAQIFTMILITFGMGIIFYGISTMTALIVEGELSGILKRQKMQKHISKLKGHYIVCGGGETGLPLIAELINNRESVVLIEQDPKQIQRIKPIGDICHVEGDATEDQNLIVAGIDNRRRDHCLSSIGQGLSLCHHDGKNAQPEFADHQPNERPKA